MPISESKKKYEVEFAKKRATVYPNGYGLVRFDYQIRVVEDAFLGPIHYFGLSDSVPAKLVLPPLERLCAGSQLDVGTAPFMNYKLISSDHYSGSMEARELTQQSTTRMCVALLELTPPAPSGAVLQYSWQWGFPHLYLVEPGSADNSGLRCAVSIEQLSMEVEFAEGRFNSTIRFKTEPILTERNDDGNMESRSFVGKKADDLGCVRYSWVMQAREGNQYIITWQLKR